MKKPLNLVPFSDPRTATASGGFDYTLPTIPLVSDHFYKVRESQQTNAIMEIGTRPRDYTIDLKGTAKITHKNYVLSIENYEQLIGKTGGTTALKLLNALMITATEQGNLDNGEATYLPFKHYMQMRGLSDAKETKDQAKRDLMTLEAITLEQAFKGKSGDWIRAKMISSSGHVRGSLFVKFTDEFLNTLEARQFMYLSKEALKLNDKQHPHSFHFNFKASLHKRMNMGKPNEDIIGVKTLVSFSPELRYKIKAKTTRFSQQILTPFERDMDALNATFTWNYVGTNGQQIETPDNLKDFLTSNVQLYWVNYPETDEIKRLKQYKKVRAKRAKAKKPTLRTKK